MHHSQKHGKHTLSPPSFSKKFLSIQSARKLSLPIYILEYISLTSLQKDLKEKVDYVIKIFFFNFANVDQKSNPRFLITL